MRAEDTYNEKVKPRFDEIGFWLRDGKTIESIAESLGISKQTLYSYRCRFDEFDALFKKDRDYCDSTVIDAVYRSAIGYTVDVPKEVYRYVHKADGTVEEKLEKREVNHIHIAPNPQSQKLWLMARKRAEWGSMTEAIESESGGIVLMPEKDIIDGDENGTGTTDK